MIGSIKTTNPNRIMNHATGLLLVCVLGVATLMPITSAHAAPDCTDPKHQNKPVCNDGGDGGGGGKPVPLSVAVVKHVPVFSHASTLYQPTDLDPSCVAGTNGLNVVFPRHDLCATLTTTTGDKIADDIKIIISRNKKTDEIESAQVQGQDVIGNDGLMHVSDEMVDTSVVVENHPDGSFTVHLHADDVRLWKCDTHLFKRQSVCIVSSGFFAIDDLYYFPDP